ncbi:uncharacterized protein LOC134293583 [Anolis carolinensis]|uniref:uncharacterized protein LOC134293583 n=1 Tax=Anolis carolinensis TaxID=28377 RepID=UPI002F2B23D6
MSQKRKSTIGKIPPKAKKGKFHQANESTDCRLDNNQETANASRIAETPEQRQAKLQQKREKARASRAAQTPEQRQARLAAMKERASMLRGAETPEQRQARLQQKREKARASTAAETPEQCQARLGVMKERASTSRGAETPEQCQARLAVMKERPSTSRAAETPEQRQARLRVKQEKASTSRAAETPEQRQVRLGAMQERASISRATETPEQHNARLQEIRDKVTTTRKGNHSNLLLEGFHYNPHKDYDQYPNVIIGQMNQICRYCHAKKFKMEPPGLCCKSGKVALPPLEQPPDELLSYMSGSTSESKHFLQNIRRYNSCFQMTSFGTTSVVEERSFPTTFRVQGQVYHTAGSMMPLPDQSPKFLQIFFMGDDQLETDQRCHYIPDVRRDIVLILQQMFHQHNHIINTFKTALERMPTDEYRVVIRADKKPVGEHERRFNAPQTNEVAIVISGDEFDQRDIIIQRRSNSLQRIPETHRWYDALQYPLIFWQGEDGYHFNIKLINPTSGIPTNKKVSAMDYYAYRIMIRSHVPNHILNCQQLFHQFIVDMYAKIETERLLFICQNQKKLRVDKYIHLRDTVSNDRSVDNIGQMVILLATFTGSPRHMHEYAQDGMTYVRSYERPDLFITFTCNPSWSDIKEELLFRQTPSDCHDLIARVFKQKQMKLINVINKSHVFGETRCCLYSIEWQKRGLPHPHNLICLKEKINPTDIDNVISAEFPNPSEDPSLYSVVTKNMIHGPCGNLNMNAPCMKEGKCSKKYPRQLVTDTQTGHDGYLLYRRRATSDGGFTAKLKIRGKTEVEVDNRWVVPYSPLLSKMFQAHINVEYCNSIKSIKYICKYVNKGSDMAVFGLTNENRNDEVPQYQLGRYISSNEAVWRIFSFPINERHPTIVHLSVHLENGQRVYFTRDNAETVAAEPPNTTLTAFFQLCQQDLFARTLLYPEVPKYYTWNASRKVFSKRKQGMSVSGHDAVASEALGRVYTVHPNNAECFFLRILLHTVRGPMSFAFLKTVNGEVCNTFREACQKLGLLEDDQH